MAISGHVIQKKNLFSRTKKPHKSNKRVVWVFFRRGLEIFCTASSFILAGLFIGEHCDETREGHQLGLEGWSRPVYVLLSEAPLFLPWEFARPPRRYENGDVSQTLNRYDSAYLISFLFFALPEPHSWRHSWWRKYKAKNMNRSSPSCCKCEKVQSSEGEKELNFNMREFWSCFCAAKRCEKKTNKKKLPDYRLRLFD